MNAQEIIEMVESPKAHEVADPVFCGLLTILSPTKILELIRYSAAMLGTYVANDGDIFEGNASLEAAEQGTKDVIRALLRSVETKTCGI